MTLRIGNNENLTRLYVGSNQVQKVYRGSTELWSAAPREDQDTITVNSDAELASALLTMSSGNGGIINVGTSGGPYNVSSNAGHATETITIRSATPENPARFQRIALFSGAQNFTFEEILVDSRDVYNSRPDSQRDLDLNNCSNVAFRFCEFVSAAAGELGVTGSITGEQLARPRDVTNIEFSDNVIRNYAWGLRPLDAVGLLIQRNKFSNIQADYIQMEAVQDVIIRDNIFGPHLGAVFSINHGDVIQLLSSPNSDTVSGNILIEGNQIFSGGPAAMQDVLLQNERVASLGRHGAITIRNNVIHDAASHGLRVEHTDGVTMENNLILTNHTAGLINVPGVPRGNPTDPRLQTSNNNLNVTVSNNIASNYQLGAWTQTGGANIEYASRGHPNYVHNHFVNADRGTTGIDLRDVRLLASSPWVGMGPALIQPISTTPELTPVMRITELPSVEKTFDAGLSMDAAGTLAGRTGVVFTWDFADDTQMVGEVVTRTFPSFAQQDVTLTVTMPDATVAAITRSFNLTDPVLLDMVFDTDFSDASSYNVGAQSIDGTTATMIVPEADAGFTNVLAIGGTTKLRLWSRGRSHLNGLTDFAVSLDFKVGETGGSLPPNGALFGYRGVTNLNVWQNGAVAGAMTTTENPVQSIASPAGRIVAGQWHNYAAVYNGSTFKLYLDGVEQGSVDATGYTTIDPTHDIFLGEVFTAPTVAARLANLKITRAAVWTP